MKACWGTILLALCCVLTSGGAHALRLDRILGIVDRFSQMGGSDAAEMETEKLAVDEVGSPELLEAEKDGDIDRTHHHHHHHHHKAPITATKTVFLQVTKHVVRHPVCLMVRGAKPPCLPAELLAGREDIWADGAQEEGLYMEPTATVRAAEATATATASSQLLVEPSTRAGRYLVLPNRETPAIEDQRSLVPRRKQVTETLVVTKVQPVTDYRVTATLEARNCIPHDVKIPLCPGPNIHPPAVKPTKPVIPIFSSILAPHKPLPPPPHHAPEEVFDSVDETLKESEATLEH